VGNRPYAYLSVAPATAPQLVSVLPDSFRTIRAPLNLLVLGLLALVAVFYLWTATSSANPIRFGGGKTDYYNLQTDAFLEGRASLLVEPAKELLALPDPYDPAANAPYRLHDLSLYHDRYYLPWGPTPALTLFMPFRALGLGDMPENLAVVLFSLSGLVFSVLLLRLLLRRFLPGTPAWLEVVAVVALALSNVAPFVLRRPAVYEVAISAGYCFVFAGLYLLASGALRERPSLPRLGLGSLCLGLAGGCRPHLLVVGAAAVVCWWWLTRGKDRTTRLRLGAVLGGPFVVCVAALLIYNVARFHSPTEFGQTYQLAGVEMRKKQTFELGYIVPGLYYYLLAPARLTLDFPYFRLPPPPAYPGHVPAGYDGVEVTGGLLPNMPILVFLLGAVPFVLTRRLRLPSGLGEIAALLVCLGGALILALSFAFWGTTMRYEMDFTSLILLAALLVWLAAFAATKRLMRRVVAVGGVVLVAYGALVGVAISMTGYYDSLRTGSPGQYRALERLFSPLPTLATMIVGRPVLVDVVNDTGYSAPVTYRTAGAGAASFWLSRKPATLKVVSPRNGRILLVAVLGRGPSSGKRSRLDVAVDGTRAPVSGHVERIPVDVERGLNELSMRAVETPAPTGPPPATAEQVVAVLGLHAENAP
jgi:hypothetical protein